MQRPKLFEAYKVVQKPHCWNFCVPFLLITFETDGIKIKKN